MLSLGTVVQIIIGLLITVGVGLLGYLAKEIHDGIKIQLTGLNTSISTLKTSVDENTATNKKLSFHMEHLEKRVDGMADLREDVHRIGLKQRVLEERITLNPKKKPAQRRSARV